MAENRETHTPGPYTDDLRGAHFVICGGCTEVMAVIPEPDLDGFGCVSADERGANMKRIKVTLNACKGIETETLEKDTVHIGIRTVAAEARADAAEALLEEARRLIGWLQYVEVSLPGPNRTMRKAMICRHCGQYDGKHADACATGTFLEKTDTPE